MSRKLDVRQWARTRLRPWAPRCSGVAHDETELLTFHNQQPPFSSPSTECLQSQFKGPLHTEDRSPAEDGTGADKDKSVDGKSDSQPNPRWVRGVKLCAIATVCLLLLNVTLIAIAAGLASKTSRSSTLFNLPTIYTGSCTISSRWNTAIHLIINVISTCVLAASNYCMQALVAPTRDDVDAFHAQRRWLDIGCATLRNLPAIPFKRLGLWALLFITATPFHLLYNTILIESISYTEFWSIVGPHDLNAHNVWNLTTPALSDCFTMGDYWDASTWDQFASQVAKGRYTRMSEQKCSEYLQMSYHSKYKGIVALADNLSVGDGGDVSVLHMDLWSDPGTVTASPFTVKNKAGEMVCTGNMNFAPDDTPQSVQHSSECLAFESKDHCQLLFNPDICIIISLTTLVKVVAMFFVARVSRSRSPPLLTTGGAVASFLERPDTTTRGICWASSRYFRNGRWKRYFDLQGHQEQNISYRQLSPRKRWGEACSVLQWLVTFIWFVPNSEGPGLCNSLLSVIQYSCFASLAAGLFAISVKVSKKIDAKQFRQFWDQEAATRHSQIPFFGNWSLMGSMVTANSAQLAVTFSYYFYNGAITSMLAAAEYSSYGIHRKPKGLRVTWPAKGSEQRSTYWLSVPYRYCIPIMVLYTIVHWLVSQSMFYVLLIPYSLDDKRIQNRAEIHLSLSPLPMVLAVALGFFMLVVLTALSLRRFKSRIPLVGSCSAAISAACHPPKDDFTDSVALGKVVWGETDPPPDWPADQRSNDHGHCSFASLGDVQAPSAKSYA